MEPQTKISAEERRRLDRQRFIGLQTQKRLLSSKVLITPANGPNTQLAKNLVLAGVNVVIYDSEVVTEDDFETNFLVGHDEEGKKRGQVVFDRLKEMNPSGKNEVYLEKVDTEKKEFFQNFTIICTSFLDYEEVKKWDKITKQVNKPYYNLVSVGLYGFAYISLGQTYRYGSLQKSEKETSSFLMKSLSFEECLDLKEIRKLKKKKQSDFLSAILMMQEAQNKSLKYDPFIEESFNSEMLRCMVELGSDFNENADEMFLRNFARLWGIDFCPTYSVIGSIISQQIIKVVQNQTEPGINWLVFNSEEGFANIVKLDGQNKKIAKINE